MGIEHCNRQEHEERIAVRHFISKHTPMEDYNNILSQVIERIENEDEMIIMQSIHRENLKANRIYCNLIRAAKLFLLLSFLLMTASVGILLVAPKQGDSMSLKHSGEIYILTAVGMFALAAILAIIAAMMETDNDNKNKKVIQTCRRRTVVLQNGNVAVIYKRMGYGRQLRRFDTILAREKEADMVEVPFFYMYVVEKVYSLKRKEGKLIAKTGGTEYLLRDPHGCEWNEDGRDNTFYFKYYIGKKRNLMEWPEHLAKIEDLELALSIERIK